MSDKKFTQAVQNSLIMVRFTCGQYRGYKRDKKETEAITEAKNAKRGTHRVNRQLFADKNGPLYQANKAADAIRNWFYTWSFPWDDISGDQSKYRLVSLKVWFEKKPEFNRRMTEVKALWEKFFDQYESLVEMDMRDQGESANFNDYLSVREIRSKFYIDATVKRVPVGGSVMMNALDNEFEKLIEEQGNHDKKIVESLVTNVWERILEPLESLADKLADPEYGFKDATIRDIAHMVSTMRGFNITDDPTIEDTLKEIEKELLMGRNPDTLLDDKDELKKFSDQFRPKKNKGDTTDRDQLVESAKKIADQMKGVI